MRRTMIAFVLACGVTLAFASVAQATHPRPGGGSPFRVPFVHAYNQCTTAAQNSNHVAPLDLDSCAPPAQQSSVLTTSTIGRGSGLARLDVIQGDAATPQDEADVHIFARASDVRCRQLNAACPAGAGSDFTGQTVLDAEIRITDRASGFGGVSATVADTSLQAPLSCASTPDPNLGSTCLVSTSADTLIPNYVRETKRTLISALTITLDDPGPNGSGYGSGCPPACGDGDEATYLTQGVFHGL
jgi:hypothetical protein